MKLSSNAKSTLIILGLASAALLGILAMVYPLLSSLYMDSVRSQIRSQYQAEIVQSDTDQLKEIREAAQAYNHQLASGQLSLLTPEENGYFDQLSPGGSQIMAYVHIPRIQVDLPVFHGVGTQVLDAGCGHMPQSSLPVGGDSTHAVISAHTGMASSPMFSDLPLLQPGDTFTIEVLGEILTYEIQSSEDIRTVLPVEVQAVQIKSGQDLCTLVTCTPFGVNTHRLLVTGHRVPTSEKEILQEETLANDVPQPSLWKEEYLNALGLGIGILIMIPACGCVCYLFLKFHKKGRYENQP